MVQNKNMYLAQREPNSVELCSCEFLITIMMQKIAPARLTGCTVVVIVSEYTSITSL